MAEKLIGNETLESVSVARPLYKASWKGKERKWRVGRGRNKGSFRFLGFKRIKFIGHKGGKTGRRGGH